MVYAKVLVPFGDKETGRIYKVGEIIELTADRFNEIRAYDRVIDVVEEKKNGK